MNFEEVMRAAAHNKQKAKTAIKHRQENLSQKSAEANLRAKKERESEKHRRRAESASKPSTSDSTKSSDPSSFKIPKSSRSTLGPSSEAVLKYQQRKVDEAKRHHDDESRRKSKQKEALIHERIVRANGKVNKRMADQLHIAPERLQQLAAKYHADVEKRQRRVHETKVDNAEHHRRIAHQSTSAEQSLVAQRRVETKKESKKESKREVIKEKHKPRGNDLFSLISQQSKMLKLPPPVRPSYDNKNVVIGQPIRDEPRKDSAPKSTPTNGHRAKTSSTNGHAPSTSSSAANGHESATKSASKRRVGGPVDFTEVLRIAEANKRGERVKTPSPPPVRKRVMAFKSNPARERPSKIVGADTQHKDRERSSHYSKLKPKANDEPMPSTSRPGAHSNGHRHGESTRHRVVDGGGVNIDDLSRDQLREMIARMQHRLSGGESSRHERPSKKQQDDKPRKEKMMRGEEPSRRPNFEKSRPMTTADTKHYAMFRPKSTAYDESDSEDSSMDDFIDDAPDDDGGDERNELRNTLRDLYKYDSRRFAGERQTDDRSMESRWQQCELEDRRSARMAREEDAREDALGRSTQLG